MLKISICDDEKNLRLNLRHILETTLELQGISFCIEEFDCGEAFLLSLNKNDYDIVFLDIEMKELDGITTAKRLREQNRKSVIIFVTSYPDFVFQGYEVRALNYILKPYHKEKILSSLGTALAELHAAAEFFYIVEQKAGSVKLPLHDILYFMSDRRSLTVFTKDTSFSFYKKLNDIELELPSYFIRIHNRYLVNINYVTALNQSSALCGSASLPVSRAYRQELAVAFARCMIQ